MDNKRQIAILGSTGSIGTQALQVIEEHSDLYEVYCLTANNRVEELAAQARKFKPAAVVIANESLYGKLKDMLSDMPDIKVYAGAKAIDEIVEAKPIDIVLTAMVGFAGLSPTIHAIKARKTICLANKETLVVAGELICKLATEYHCPILPVDSEHSAIFQSLVGEDDNEIEKILLTASGGPFRNFTMEQLAAVTKEDALRHPTWDMGAKITIDSATMMNKGFEVIEAKWLYDCPIEKIHTIVQPESIIHSMVEFEDKGILAQMSYPTMELPIQLALTYPERYDCALKPLDFEKLGAIRFLPLERSAFPCYDMALKSIEKGDNYPCALNGAGEVAVRAFLDGKLSFLGIADAIEYALENTERVKATDYDTLVQTDKRARLLAKEFIK